MGERHNISAAIVTGATGFIGSWLVKLLLLQGIRVIALGRREFSQILAQRLEPHKLLTYVQLPQEQIAKLPDILKEQGLEHSLGCDCVFFNFAWGGRKGLSDLDLEAQMQNVDAAVQSYEAAEKLGCRLFIQVGTMEEAFAEAYLPLDYHRTNVYNRHLIYAEAKRCARMTLKALSANFNCKLIMVNNSHVMGPLDYRDSLLTVTAKKILAGESLRFTSGEQNFDVVSIFDLVNAFKLIAECGVANAEYWIGSGQARRLREYIEILLKLHPVETKMEFGALSYNDVRLPLSVFSPERLQQDTGFYCQISYEQIASELFYWLQTGEVLTHLR